MPLVFQPCADSRLSVIGVTGQGKSIFRRTFQRQIYRQTLWNPMGDYNIGERMTVDEYRANLEDFRRGSLRITVEPGEWDDEAMFEEFDACCAYVEEVGAQHFAIEEPSLVCTPNSVPPHFNKLCVRGRHRAVSLAIYGQRFHQFPLIARGQSNEIIAYRQMEPDDVDDFEKRIYPHISPRALNQLPDHHFVHWTPERGARFCNPLPLIGETHAYISRNASNSSGGSRDDGGSDENQNSPSHRIRRSAVQQLNNNSAEL